MLKCFLLQQKHRNYLSFRNASRILPPSPIRSTYWPDDHFNMSYWGGIKSTMACSTQQSYNQSCWSVLFCSKSIETIVPIAMHREFYLHCNSEQATDQTITSTWASFIGLSRDWPVPPKQFIINHVEVISFAAVAWKLSYLSKCIEMFTFLAIP